MKKTTRTLLIIGLLFINLQTQAQFKFGIKGGMNVSNIKQNMADSEDQYNTKGLIGYHIGLTADYDLLDAVSVQIGLLFSSKGYKDDLEDGLANDITAEGYDKFITNYVEIPIHLTYKINENFQLYGGPYVSFGVGGVNKWDYDYTYNGNSAGRDGENNIKHKYSKLVESDYDGDDSNTEYYSGFDAGLDFGIGYKTGPILINVGYSVGLVNIIPGRDFDDNYEPLDYKTTNRVFSVSLSYILGD